jgi:hypothetical protein
MGVKTTPVVARGDQYVLGQVIGDVAKFLGLKFDGGPALTPSELVDRACGVLQAARRFAVQIPLDQFNECLPMSGRRRTYRELAHHLVRIQEAMLEAADGVEFTVEQPVVPPGDDITQPAQIADYAGEVAARLRAWWDRESKTDAGATRTVATYFGLQPLSVLMERCAWHSAQHTRQLEHLLGRLGVKVDGPLRPEDLRGLPLPDKVWED